MPFLAVPVIGKGEKGGEWGREMLFLGRGFVPFFSPHVVILFFLLVALDGHDGFLFFVL